MSLVDVNGARLWVEQEGEGPAVLFVHGGLGDSRLWEPEAHTLAARFRTIRYDLRLWGRSESPAMTFSAVDDLVGLLDALGVERAALVGLSLGGGLALDAALAHPDRVWAIAHVAGGVTGMPVSPYTDEQDAEFDAAVASGDLETAAAIDFAVWAPLGTYEELRELWRSTPDALGVPDGTELRRPEPAHDRLDRVAVPTLVVRASHDPPALREVGAHVARQIPGARLVDVDSDHYLTLREPGLLTQLLEEFLVASRPSTPSNFSG